MNPHDLQSSSSSSSSTSPHFSLNGSLFCFLVKFLFRVVVVMTLVFHSPSSAQTQLDTEDNGNFVEIQKSVEPQVLNRLESQFLHLFGMKRRPAKRVKNIRVPQYLIDIYEAQSKTEFSTSNLNLPGRHTRTANTVRTFYHKSSESAVDWGHRINFDLSGIPETEKVTGAELRLFFTTKLINKEIQSVRVIVNDVMRPPGGSQNNPNSEPIIFPIDSKFVDLKRRQGNGENSGFWLTFDVFPAVIRWTQKQDKKKKNHGLVIQVVHPNGQQLDFSSTIHHVRVTRATDNNKNSDLVPSESYPILFTYSDDGVNKNRPRNLGSGTVPNAGGAGIGPRGGKRQKTHRVKNAQDVMCSKQKMYVNFEDVGWSNWIVAPKGYSAYVCSGKCPYPMGDHLNATNHAVIQNLVNSVNPQLVPPACCVPTKYKPLQILYQDEADKTILKTYNEMIVDACGCS